ncbi:MAG: hypothetical protein PHV39_08970 [Methanomicrobium sp.]|nr:hypothetical protein [Methanomicrobium sp.]
MRKEISIIILALICIFAAAVSGCTEILAGQTENTISATSLSTEISSSSPDLTPAEPLKITSDKISWPDVNPPYDDNTKKELIEFAKKEIMRVFPYVDINTLDGHFEDSNGYVPPDIVFDNVNATFENYSISVLKRTNGHLKYGDPLFNNIVEIKINSKTGELSLYKPKGYIVPSSDENLIPYEDAEKKSIEFIKKVKDEDFLSEYDYNFSQKGDEGRGVAFFEIDFSYKGVDYLTDNLIIRYDLGEDAVIYYSDDSNNYDLLKKMTTLSPEPSISFDEAKTIFKEKIAKEYPGNDFKISYLSYGSALTWDSSETIFVENPEPVKLVWHVYFNDEDMRKEHSGSITVANIDAHTGEIIGLRYREIIGLRYREIIIPPYTEEEKERMAKYAS